MHSWRSRVCSGSSFVARQESIAETPEREPPSTRKEFHDGRNGKPKPYEVGVQIPCGVHSEMPKKDAVRGVTAALGRSVAQAGCAERESNRGRSPAARSGAHDDRDPAEVCGVAGDWVYQGEECNSPGAGVWGEEEEFRGSAFLARGSYVSTVGRDETVIRDYIRNQEQQDKRLDQMNLWR